MRNRFVPRLITCWECGNQHDNWDYGCVDCTREHNRRERLRRAIIARMEFLSPRERRQRSGRRP